MDKTPRYILVETYVVMTNSGHIDVDYHPATNSYHCCECVVCSTDNTCEHIEFVKEYIRDKFVMLDSLHQKV